MPLSGQGASADKGPKGPSTLICLLRLDLRIEDNALWHFAHKTAAPSSSDGGSNRVSGLNVSKLPEERVLSSTADHLLPVFVFDEREMELSGLPGYIRKGPEARTREFRFWKTGAFRARFIAETVYDLRTRLRERGSDLCIRFGRTEDVISNLVSAFQARGQRVEAVWMQKEMTSAEVSVEEKIEKRLRAMSTPVRYVHGKTLLHPVDLPFEIADTPDVFTPFRKKVEVLGSAMVRPTYTAPQTFKKYPDSLPNTPDYSLDITYEVDVDGLSKVVPETNPKTAEQISFYDILRYLLLPLNDGSPFVPGLESSALLQQRHHASAFPLRGGESAALDRLEWYFVRGKSPDSSTWGRQDPPPVARYKQTRNNLLGHAYSTKMSPFLAYGSISPRQIWEALLHHESIFGGEDQNIYWVKFELLWRDYFFFVAEKFGDLLFHLGGFEYATDPPQAQKKLEPGWWKTWDPSNTDPGNEVNRFLEGRTGIPFIDANIRELCESGFISNRGRQNLASYVSHDLGYDWRIGAEFFQSYLIDYDPTSNYGNWAYVAGVGCDPRASRRFNIVKQAKDYDSHGEYVKTWLPALRGLPADYVHTPWLLDAEERRRYNVKSSEMTISMDTYPEKPMTEDEGWRKHYERKQGVGSRMYGNPQEKIKDKKNLRSKSSGNRTPVDDPRGSSESLPAFKTGPPHKPSYTGAPLRSGSPFSRGSPSTGSFGNRGGIHTSAPRSGPLPNPGPPAGAVDGLSTVVRPSIGLTNGRAAVGRDPSVRSKAEEAVSWRRS